MPEPIRVTVWNEFRHEQSDQAVRAVYPDGIHEAIAAPLRRKPGLQVRTATLDQPENGLPAEVLADTDVLIWWAHVAHAQVREDVCERVHARILDGMGFIALHSAHNCMVLKRLLGTSCRLKWREVGERERLWVIEPGHPIAEGLGEYFELPRTEMYGERNDIPPPDQTVFISWFAGGEVFRSGICYFRGAGRVFYFRPGHETFPIYMDENVQRVIYNAVRWAAPVAGPAPVFGNVEPLEQLRADG